MHDVVLFDDYLPLTTGDAGDKLKPMKCRLASRHCFLQVTLRAHNTYIQYVYKLKRHRINNLDKKTIAEVECGINQYQKKNLQCEGKIT